MPKIDPVTGCEVMTTAEFFQAEAEREGKGRSGGEVMAETFQDIAREFENDNKLIVAEYENPTLALVILKREAAYEADGPQPVEVLKVTNAKHQQTMNRSSGGFTAEVRCTDGKVRTCHYAFASWAGTRLDPPEYDSELNWE